MKTEIKCKLQITGFQNRNKVQITNHECWNENIAQITNRGHWKKIKCKLQNTGNERKEETVNL